MRGSLNGFVLPGHMDYAQSQQRRMEVRRIGNKTVQNRKFQFYLRMDCKRTNKYHNWSLNEIILTSANLSVLTEIIYITAVKSSLYLFLFPDTNASCKNQNGGRSSTKNTFVRCTCFRPPSLLPSIPPSLHTPFFSKHRH